MKLEFQFNDMPVGCFKGESYPNKDGQYAYEPYRGPGHLQMQLELQKNGLAECYYEVGAERIHFTVVNCPGYGKLELVGSWTANK